MEVNIGQSPIQDVTSCLFLQASLSFAQSEVPHACGQENAGSDWEVSPKETENKTWEILGFRLSSTPLL